MDPLHSTAADDWLGHKRTTQNDINKNRICALFVDGALCRVIRRTVLYWREETVGRQSLPRSVSTHNNTTQKKPGHTSMTRFGLEPMIPGFERLLRSKTAVKKMEKNVKNKRSKKRRDEEWSAVRGVGQTDEIRWRGDFVMSLGLHHVLNARVNTGPGNWHFS
jgi:hypothetical protein